VPPATHGSAALRGTESASRTLGSCITRTKSSSAADENSSASGLGILTLMNDYGARLGWIFTEAPAAGTVTLSTFASLSLN
jgi:hypothetical protein